MIAIVTTVSLLQTSAYKYRIEKNVSHCFPT